MQNHKAGGVAGSIPAYAGEPKTGNLNIPVITVYPRVCGGTVVGDINAAIQGGLSPRMRGNRPHSSPAAKPPRSIPAYAGEP